MLGHCSLKNKQTLKIIGKHQTGLCEGCREEESVEHIIMRCKRYEMQRQVMKNKLRHSWGAGDYIKRVIKRSKWDTE